MRRHLSTTTDGLDPERIWSNQFSLNSEWIGTEWIQIDWIGIKWIGINWIGIDWAEIELFNTCYVNEGGGLLEV